MTRLTEPTAPDSADTERTRTITFLESSLARHLSWIAAADAKTAVIFTVAIAMVAFPAAIVPKFGEWTPAGVAVSIIAGLCLLGALAGLTLAVVPRMKPPATSLIYFGEIARRTVENYRRDVLGQTNELYLEDLIQQTHVNATIASKKYYWIKRATILLYMGLIPWMVTILLLFKERQ